MHRHCITNEEILTARVPADTLLVIKEKDAVTREVTFQKLINEKDR